jgi:hypothetical protein
MCMMSCPDCGAVYSASGESCRARFDVLLAMDHSRAEPWGSRHGLAFAAFALQHPTTFSASLDRAWTALYAIFVLGNASDFVFRRLVVANGALPSDWTVPVRPQSPTRAPSFTIADMSDFAADTYPEDVERLGSASLAMWGVAT